MRAPVTLNDIALAAGVSKSTVANVYNRPDRVRPELRERIEAVARELGFAGPDPRGRLLSLGKVNAIGVVPPADAGFAWSFTSAYMQAFLTGVSEVCEEHQVGLVLISPRERDGSSGIRKAVVDGMILGTSNQADVVEPAMRQRMPFVLMDAEGGRDMSSIRFDERGGARQLVRHMLELGHRRFAFAFVSRRTDGPILHLPGDGRPRLAAAYEQEWECYRGAAEALAEAGLSIDDIPLIEACGEDQERRDFGDFAETLLDVAPEATALVGFSDIVTYRLIEAARRRGIAVPRQLSIAGYGEPALAARTDPPLTVVVQSVPAMERGRLAAAMLFEPERRHLVLPLEFMLGASTAPPMKASRPRPARKKAAAGFARG